MSIRRIPYSAIQAYTAKCLRLGSHGTEAGEKFVDDCLQERFGVIRDIGALFPSPLNRVILDGFKGSGRAGIGGGFEALDRAGRLARDLRVGEEFSEQFCNIRTLLMTCSVMENVGSGNRVYGDVENAVFHALDQATGAGMDMFGFAPPIQVYESRSGIEVEVNGVEGSDGEGSRRRKQNKLHTLAPLELVTWIVQELGKNAVVATCKRFEPNPNNPSLLPPIRVLLSSTTDSVSIRLSDAGGGVGDNVERLFTLFATTTPLTEDFYGYSRHHGVSAAGHGVGLPFSRSLARWMGGDVALLSTPGHGTIAQFTFRKINWSL